MSSGKGSTNEELTNYGKSFVDIFDNSLTVANVRKRVSDEHLWFRYTGISYSGRRTISAPYRQDSTPSFSMREDDKGVIRFKDNARPDWSGDIFDYMKLTEGKSLIESLTRINDDFDLGLKQQLYGGTELFSSVISTTGKTKHESSIEQEGKKRSKEINLFQIIRKGLEQSDNDYWLQYGITRGILESYNVYCVGKLFMNKYPFYVYNSSNPCYAYVFPRTNHLKAYFPYSDTIRFIGNIDNCRDIQGYDQCDVKRTENNKILILTKSMKDCMCIRGSVNIDAMAIHGENHRFNSDFIRHLKKYYQVIISLYDRDKAGVKGALYLWRQYGIPANFIPREYRDAGAKDISDMYLLAGKDAVIEYLHFICNKQKKQLKK